MRPLPLLVLVGTLLSGCGLAGADVPEPKGPLPTLVPMEDLLTAPEPKATKEAGAALADRGQDLRERAARP